MGFLFCRRQNTLKNIRTLSINEKVMNIILLRDEKLSCLTPQSITIYDKELNIFESFIDESLNFMSYHTELPNGDIIVGCMSGDIIIYTYKKAESEKGLHLNLTLKGHSHSIGKIIEIDGKIISCSSDTTMKIWEKNNSNYKCTKTIEINDEEYLGNTNILKINEKEIVSSADGSKCIKFWDIKNDFKEIAKIKGVNSPSLNCSMCMLNEKILIMAGGNKGILLIDIIAHQLIKNCKKHYFYSIIKLSDGTILAGCEEENNNHCLIEYRYEKDDLVEMNSKEKAHDKIITGLVENSYGIIFTSSFDQTLKVWV